MLTEIIMSGHLDAQLNLVGSYITVTAELKENNLGNFSKWMDGVLQN